MEILPTPVFWLGEFHGLYSLWDRKELDMTERLSLMHSISHTKIKWVKDINRPETIELPEENMGRVLFDIKSSNVPVQEP